MAKIKITEGQWTDECLTELNITNAHTANPDKGFDKILTYGEKRYLMTFITAGATNGAFTVARTDKAYATRIPAVPSGELIDGKAWKYNIMGRIQKACEIVGTGAVGTPTAGSQTQGGFFQLKLADNYLQPDMNAFFYNGKAARVQGQPRPAPGYYLYSFQTFPGDTFSWDTWVAPQIGRKTLFGGYSTHGERSLRGYGRAHYPDSYINHMTIQRKGAAITGDANAEKVLWYMKEGGEGKGWIYWIEAQSRAQFLMEDEFQKWWGKSTMKDSLGNLLTTPSMIDPETGMPLVAGDGYYEQVKGANDVEASGAGGLAVWDDFSDQIREAKKYLPDDSERLFYYVTGSDGIENINNQARYYMGTNFNLTSNLSQDDTTRELTAGYNFTKFNIQGTNVLFVENPMMNDEAKFPKRMANGRLAMANTYFLVDASVNNSGRPNVEIRTRGRQGVNRNMVYYYENGMTGEGQAMASVDGKEFQMLKENMFVIYNTKTSGIITPPETA